MKDSLKKYLEPFGNVISLLSVVFVFYAMWKTGFDFNLITDVPLFIFVCGLGVILKVLSVLLSANAWTVWLAFLNRSGFGWHEAISAYGRANISKYLPGNVMHFVARNVFAAKIGLDQRKIAVSSLLEIAEMALSAMLMGIIFSSRDMQAAYEYLGGPVTLENAIRLLAILSIAAAAVLVISQRNKLKHVLREYTLKDFFRTAALTMLHYILTLLLLSAIMVLLYGYVLQGVPDAQISYELMIGFITAWLLGYIMPGASGGLGVREMVLTLLLGSVIGQGTILMLAVVHRLITIIGDFLLYGLICLYERKKGENNAGR